MSYVIRVIYSVNTSTIKDYTFRTKGRDPKAFFLLSPLKSFFFHFCNRKHKYYIAYLVYKKYLILNKLKILFLTKYTFYHFL